MLEIALFHSFLWPSNIPLHIYIYVCVYTKSHTTNLYPFIYQWTFWFFHVLVTVDNAAMNIEVYVFWGTIVIFGYRHRSGVAGLYNYF